MFHGSDKSGRPAAVLTSFVTTCNRLCIDPFAYLRDVFERTCTHPVVNSRVASGQVLYTGGKFQFGMVFNSTKYMALRP